MIHYNETAIQRTQEWLVERAMKPSTSPRLAGHLYEAAETIAQLKRELSEAKSALAENSEMSTRSKGEQSQGSVDGIKLLNDLESALDEIWKHKAKLYDAHREDYIRGQMNVILAVQKAIADIKRNNEPPKDLWEWVKLLEEELENEI